LASDISLSKLASYLSGNLAGYDLVTSVPGEIVITPKDSYKEQFQRAKAGLNQVLERCRMLKEDQRALRRAQVYSVILSGKFLTAYMQHAQLNLNQLSELDDIWFTQLPQDVRWTLIGSMKINRM